MANLSDYREFESVERQLRQQTNLRLVYSLLVAFVIVGLLVSGFSIANQTSAGGVGNVFVKSWPNTLVFTNKTSGEDLDVADYAVPDAFYEAYEGRTDFDQRLKNEIADLSGLGGKNVGIDYRYHSFFNPLNYVYYTGNVLGRTLSYISRTVRVAWNEPNRIFLYPPYEAGDADANVTIYEGTGLRHCGKDDDHNTGTLSTDLSGGGLDASGNVLGMNQNALTLRQQRETREAERLKLPCATLMDGLFLQHKAAWFTYVIHALETLNYAFFATLIGAFLGFLLSLFASRNLVTNRTVNFVTRRIMDICRAFPEIIIVFVLAIAFHQGSIIPIIFAVAFHTTGALGKLYTEVIENVDMKPLEGLASVGGAFTQRIGFGLMPQVFPNLLSYTALRVEINVRASAILGFVGGSGFGQDLNLAESRDNGIAIIFLLFLLVAMIILIDQLSLRLRRRLIGNSI